MYARNAYAKQRQDNLLPNRSPSTSDEDANRNRAPHHVGGVGGVGGLRESAVGAVGSTFQSSASSISSGGSGDAIGNSSHNHRVWTNPFSKNVAMVRHTMGTHSPSPVYPGNNPHFSQNYNHNYNYQNQTMNPNAHPSDDSSHHSHYSHDHSANSINSVEAKVLSLKRRRARAFLVTSALAFVGMLVLDGVAQFSGAGVGDVHVEGTVERKMGGVVGMAESGYDSNNEHNLQGMGMNSAGLHDTPMEPMKPNESKGLMRRLVGSFFQSTDADAQQSLNQARLLQKSNSQSRSKHPPQPPAILGQPHSRKLPQTPHSPARIIHKFPLLPKHALQSRRRRELMRDQKPIPPELSAQHEDVMYHAPASRRRRMYPMPDGEGGVVDARMVDWALGREQNERNQLNPQNQRRVEGVEGEQEQQDEDQILDETTLYETGSLYQGYGTHYLDLYVGTPPQRQTVIVDTGSSVTAFPCTGCDSCGANPSLGLQYHVDPDFDQGASSTFEEATCHRATVEGETAVPCPFGMCVHENLEVADSPQVCKLTVSYAEGSSWTAVEVSDVVYPSGPHNESLTTVESREEHGVGVGMGDITDEMPFDWMEFRLMFGCQTRVTGLFRTQLEAGIMGMDNRAGAFWLQLKEHYKAKGHVMEAGDEFDPSLFSLCYDRQPLTLNLEEGVGSGQFTLGGTDDLMHLTPMVYADNIHASEGWYTVRIKGIFLRTHGGDLANPHPNTSAIRYVRVDAEENFLNNDSRQGSGVIVDSGTTDTYLSQLLKPAFQAAWQDALKNPNVKYNNELIAMTLEEVKRLPTILIVLQGHQKSVNRGLQPDASEAVGMAGHPNHGAFFQKNQHQTSHSISENDVVVAIPPEHYMEESHREPGKFTARVYFTERFGAQAILGSNFIMGHEVLFDNDLGRLGFAESHCDYSRYLSEKDALLGSQLPPEASQEADQATDAEVDLKGEDDLHASGWARGLEKRQVGKNLKFPG